MPFARQGEAGDDLGMVPMEGSVEAGHLRQTRSNRLRGPDSGQIVRLMQRRERA